MTHPMMNHILFYVCLLLVLMTSCSSDSDDEKDMVQPVITDQGIVASPMECEVFHRNEVIAFHYLMTDDHELGAYNIEVHNNFDHHTHSTSATDCEMDEPKAPQKPWVFNRDYSIPAGLRSFEARHDITIPDTIDTGDYHFMIRLTDRAGWQQIHSVAIKIVE